jgi:uncharacterized protein YuzE
MKQRYLEVTFRKGKPFAAYLYLPRKSNARVARTLDGGHGVRIDVDDAGTPIGIEITAPSAITVSELNGILAQHGISELDEAEWAPLAA